MSKIVLHPSETPTIDKERKGKRYCVETWEGYVNGWWGYNYETLAEAYDDFNRHFYVECRIIDNYTGKVLDYHH